MAHSAQGRSARASFGGQRLRGRLSLAAAYGHSLFAWHTDGTPRLISASFAVTNRCNLRCHYCNTPFLDPNDLPLGSIATIFERLARLGVKRLGLTGGEPLVRKDIGSILGMARAHGFYITFNTNLMLYKKREETMREVDLFFTSIDGAREQHEAARGEGSFEGVLEAAQRIVDRGKPLVAICVVTEHNLDQANTLIDLAERIGFRIHFQPQCTDTAIVRGRVAASLTNQRARSYWSALLELKRSGRAIASSTPYLEALSSWDDFSQTAVLDPNSKCAASRAFLYIDPAGHAYPCAYTKGKSDPVDMLSSDWRAAVGRDLPCTRCSVGPYLEFNLLYQRPVRSALSALQTYV